MLSDEVYDQLLDLLGSGAWPKGSRLPSEHELARRFAVSRPILRQALVRLRAEGRLYSRKGSGTCFHPDHAHGQIGEQRQSCAPAQKLRHHQLVMKINAVDLKN
jgi:DNA-binding FadR family transcriptional regulator